MHEGISFNLGYRVSFNCKSALSERVKIYNKAKIINHGETTCGAASSDEDVESLGLA